MDAFGRYRLVSRLAAGGMAEVYLAVLTGAQGFEKPAVVKRMLPHLAAQEEYREMFIQEARLMASLSHSNIVSVLDFGEADGGYFLALEYVDGADLGRALSRGPLAPALAVHVAAQVLRGLAYVHDRRDARGEPLGIVHRDVSPQNILLGRNGDVKLGDFGIARTGRVRRTAPGTLKGKVAYMSPEQAQGAAVDARSDLFSMGLVLFEALSGRSPYAGKAGLQLLQAVQEAALPRLECEPRLAEVVARALRREPRERWQSAAELLRALQASGPQPPAGPHEVAELASTLLALPGAPPPVGEARGQSPFSRVFSEAQGPDDEEP